MNHPQDAAAQPELRGTPAYYRRVAVGGLVLQVLLIASVWGRWWAAGALVASFAARAAFNQWWVARGRRPGRSLEPLILCVNAGLTAAEGVIAGWTVPAWLLLTFSLVVADGFSPVVTRKRAVVTVAIIAPVALLTGGAPLDALVFTAFSAVTYVVSDARARALRRALTELQQANQELVRTHEELHTAHQRMAEQEKLSTLGVLAAGIVHEINNPMAYVSANVRELLREMAEQPDLPQWLREYLDDLLPATVDGIQRVNAIVADLRRFARKEKPAFAPFDLVPEIHVAARLAHGEVRKYGCRLQLNLEPLPPVYGCAQQLTQVLLNLIVNGAQACEGRGNIQVSSAAVDGHVEIRVRDDGKGMTPEIAAQIFQPFFTTKPPGVGTGLGLSVVHGIVEAHGGAISVDSAPGAGSTFLLRLPRYDLARAEVPIARAQH